MDSYRGAAGGARGGLPATAWPRRSTQRNPRAQPLTPERLRELDLPTAASHLPRALRRRGRLHLLPGGHLQPGLDAAAGADLPGQPPRHRPRETCARRGHPPAAGRGAGAGAARDGAQGAHGASSSPDPPQFNRADRLAARRAGDALELRLREVLREELGGIYALGVGGARRRDPRAPLPPDHRVRRRRPSGWTSWCGWCSRRSTR